MTTLTSDTPRKKRRASVSLAELAGTIRATCAWSIENLDDDDAQGMADDIIDFVIVAVRRELPQRSVQEWTLALADLRGGIAEYLARQFDGVAIDIENLAHDILAGLAE